MVFINNHEHDESCPEFNSEGRDMNLLWVCTGTQWVTDKPTSTEVRTTSATGGEKGTKPERFDLIPVAALSKVAQLYGRGAEKYSEHNWRKGYEWSKSYAALQRHSNAFWNGEDLDPEMQLPHMASVVFHALTLLTFMDEQKQFDDRFKITGGSSNDDYVVEKALEHGLKIMREYAKTSNPQL